MARKTAQLLPASLLRLQAFGGRLRMARLRRKLTAKQVAERAGMSALTLRNVEEGGAGVTIGAYLSVMRVLGAEKDIELLLAEDTLGRQLQDSALVAKPASRLTSEKRYPMPESTMSAAHAAESGVDSSAKGDSQRNFGNTTHASALQGFIVKRDKKSSVKKSREDEK